MIAAKKKVLVIDDDPEDLGFIQEILKGGHFDCLAVSSAIEGLELAETWQPDVILLDLMLPMMSGYGILRELKKSPLTRKIPVVILTSLRDEEVAEVSVDMGASAFLSKDCVDQNLVSMVQEYASPLPSAGGS